MNTVCELLLGWSSVAGIEFNTEILVRASGVVTRGEKNTAKAVTEFLVEVADVCGASGS
jgi:hypothetical protein